ncbi:MAG: hypothetical protein NVS2B7_41020 [Herpetosiphon sp.]
MSRSTKIVLIQDVPALGKSGDIKEVAPGYARNYLLPKGFATAATPGLIKQAQERAEAQRRRDLRTRNTMEALSERINGQTLRFEVRVGEMERLYGSITSGDIAEKLARQIGTEVDRRRIELGDPIKRAGVYSVVVNLGHKLEPRINVVVEGEGGAGQAEAAVEQTAPTTEEVAPTEGV